MTILLLAFTITVVGESSVAAGDSLPRDRKAVVVKQKKDKRKFLDKVREVFKGFSSIDTNYVEPQKYNFTVMLQNTNTYEAYTLTTSTGQKITFAPDVSVKAGPYVGWHWIFLGYAIDFSHLDAGKGKQDFSLSLYSSKLGIDLFYRRTGNDYKIRRMELGSDIDTRPLKNANFGGIHASIKGFNAYYILNNRKFSYPAAYSQSTRQKRSAGSMLVGVGYTTHRLDVNWQQLDQLIDEKLGEQAVPHIIDSTLMREQIHYSDLSASCGYAYNWVFARNWLFDISLSAALAYKHSSGNMEHEKFSFRGFRFRNFNIDGIMRTGIVWNTSKWYAGANAVFHSYYYRKSQFSASTYFGNVNIYVGFNFGKIR